MEIREIISSGLLEMYVTGAASPAEGAQVEQWRNLHPEVKAELLQIETAMEAYAMEYAVIPSASVKDNILASVNKQKKNTTSAPGKVVSIFSLSRIAAAASVLFLFASTLFYYNKYKEVNDKYQEGQQQLASLNERMTDMDKDMNIVQSKYSEPVALHGLDAAPDAGAKIFWMKNTGEVYVDPINMPMAPAGKQYQLWAIVDGKPVDAGLINSKDGKKYSIQKMKSFGKAQAFAITLENEGGNPEPKGTMYVKGDI